jgi:hypothetical protein
MRIAESRANPPKAADVGSTAQTARSRNAALVGLPNPQSELRIPQFQYPIAAASGLRVSLAPSRRPVSGSIRIDSPSPE